MTFYFQVQIKDCRIKKWIKKRLINQLKALTNIKTKTTNLIVCYLAVHLLFSKVTATTYKKVKQILF